MNTSKRSQFGGVILVTFATQFGCAAQTITDDGTRIATPSASSSVVETDETPSATMSAIEFKVKMGHRIIGDAAPWAGVQRLENKSGFGSEFQIRRMRLGQVAEEVPCPEPTGGCDHCEPKPLRGLLLQKVGPNSEWAAAILDAIPSTMECPTGGCPGCMPASGADVLDRLFGPVKLKDSPPIPSAPPRSTSSEAGPSPRTVP